MLRNCLMFSRVLLSEWMLLEELFELKTHSCQLPFSLKMQNRGCSFPGDVTQAVWYTPGTWVNEQIHSVLFFQVFSMLCLVRHKRFCQEPLEAILLPCLVGFAHMLIKASTCLRELWQFVSVCSFRSVFPRALQWERTCWRQLVVEPTEPLLRPT